MDSFNSQTPDSRGDPQEARPLPQRQSDVGGLLWRAILHPSTLIVTTAVMVLLVLAAALLPQLPDQLRDEPAAAARWLLTTATAYGSIGPSLRGAGLFNVLDSLFFRLSLALLTTMISAHLIDQIGNALSLHHLRHNLCALSASEIGREIVGISRSIFQQIIAVQLDTVDAERTAQEVFAQRFDAVHACRFRSDDQEPRPDAQSTNHEQEIVLRSIWVNNGLSYWLRPLLALGLLSALSIVWLYLYFGWQIHSPLLAPGDTYRLPSREVVITYSMEPDSYRQEAKRDIMVQISNHVYTGTVESDISARLGASRVSGQSGDLVLLVRDVDGTAVLAEPGQLERRESIGVILPGPGSEESILLPSVSSGLRIVRRTDQPDAFFVEVYQGTEVRPRHRIEVSGPTIATLSSDEETLELELVPVRGINVTIRHIPGAWLLWIALLLCAIGFYGIIQPPSVAVVETERWADMGALMTIRASESDDLEVLIAIEEGGSLNEDASAT